MTYRPLTDEDLEKVRRGSFVSPEHEVISRLTQQASRANALAEAVRQQGCECHLLGEGHTPDCMTKTHALAAYLGETNE